MLKRLSVFTMLLLYVITASGFALNLHYCGNNITSVKIDAPAKPCGPEKMKCCHDKHVDVKVKDAHQAQAACFLAKLFCADRPAQAFQYYLLPLQETAISKPADRGPPDLLCGLPVYLKNCNFRI